MAGNQNQSNQGALDLASQQRGNKRKKKGKFVQKSPQEINDEKSYTLWREFGTKFSISESRFTALLDAIVLDRTTLDKAARQLGYRFERVSEMVNLAKVSFSDDRGFYFDHPFLDLWVQKDGQLCAKHYLSESLWIQMTGNDLAAIEHDMKIEIDFFRAISAEDIGRMSIRAKNGLFSVKYSLSDSIFGIESATSLKDAITAAKEKAAKYQSARQSNRPTKRPMPLANGNNYAPRTLIAPPVRKTQNA
jgi:hypothetical protein